MGQCGVREWGGRLVAARGRGVIWVACVQLLVQHTNSTIGSALPERAQGGLDPSRQASVTKQSALLVTPLIATMACRCSHLAVEESRCDVCTEELAGEHHLAGRVDHTHGIWPAGRGCQHSCHAVAVGDGDVALSLRHNPFNGRASSIQHICRTTQQRLSFGTDLTFAPVVPRHETAPLQGHGANAIRGALRHVPIAA